MIVHIREIIEFAEKRRIAVGAFNTSNLEITQGIIAGAIARKSPVIVQTSLSALSYAGWETLFSLMTNAVQEWGKKVPIALHLDHCPDLSAIQKALDLGYQSVMFDGSMRPLRKNIRLTKSAAMRAKRAGAWIQGEIGRIPGSEDWVSASSKEAYLTDVSQAKRFVQETRVDTLAISVGTMHGVKKIKEVKPRIDVQRIFDIHRALPSMPLVLHGASHLNSQIMTQSIAAGIRIFNIDTDLRFAFMKGLRFSLAKNSKDIDPRKIMTQGRAEVQKIVEQKIYIMNKGKT